MIRSDFDSLKMGQEIYGSNGDTYVIKGLSIHGNGNKFISTAFDSYGNVLWHDWEGVYGELRLNKPIQKTKYYLWSICYSDGQWYKTNHYASKDFLYTDGTICSSIEVLPKDKRICHENEFIEV